MFNTKFKITAINFFVLLAIFIIGAFLRFHNIDELPVFVDEAGHVLINLDEKYDRVVAPEEIGRPLLSILFKPAIYFSKVFDIEPLIACRIQTALAGLMTAIVIFQIVRLCFSSLAAGIAFSLWLLLPYTVFHERMALQDPYSALFVAISTLSLLISTKKNDYKEILFISLSGFFLSLAFLNKITTIVNIIWILSLYYVNSKNKIKLNQLSAFLLGFLIAFILIKFPDLNEMMRRINLLKHHHTSQFSLTDIFILFMGFHAYYYAFLEYFTTLQITIFLIGLSFTYFIRDKISKMRISLIIVMLIDSYLYSGVSYCRYVMSQMIPVIILVSTGLAYLHNNHTKSLKKQLLGYLIIVIFFTDTLNFTNQIINYDHMKATADNSQYKSDIRQYTTNWSSGTKIDELLKLINKYSNNSIIITEDGWTILSQGLSYYCVTQYKCITKQVDLKQVDLKFVLNSYAKDYPHFKLIYINAFGCITNQHDNSRYCTSNHLPKFPGYELTQFAELKNISNLGKFQIFELTKSKNYNEIEKQDHAIDVYPDKLLSPHSKLSFKKSATHIKINGKLLTSAKENTLKVYYENKEIYSKILTRDSSEFEISLLNPVKENQPIIFTFSDWIVVDNPHNPKAIYHNKVRAVSYKINKIEYLN